MPKFSKRTNFLKDFEAVATSHAVKVYIFFVSAGLCTHTKS